MGIYTNGHIYGIRIIAGEDARVLFERTGEEILDTDTLLEAKQFYDGLVDKSGIQIRVYNECSTTYGDGVFSMWSEMSLDSFLTMV